MGSASQSPDPQNPSTKEIVVFGDENESQQKNQRNQGSKANEEDFELVHRFAP
jgi:hypothetical protein